MATIVESVTLQFTDLTGSQTGCTTLGSNKFWKGWSEDIGGGMGNFECRWGSTGTPGNDKGSLRGIPLGQATDQLRKKVREKESKGYTRLQVRDDAEEVRKAAAKGVNLTNAPLPAPTAPSPTQAFHPEVGRLLGVIYKSMSSTVVAGLSAQAGATADNPIGNLSDQQLDLGGAILDDIGVLLEKHLGREAPSNVGTTLPLGRDGVPLPEVIALTNRFMSNVPREIGRDMRGRDNLHRLVLSSYERLQAQRDFLQLLRDAHIAKGTFTAAAAATTTGGKEQVWYDGLQCTIEACDASSADFRRVVEVFTTGQSKKNSNYWRGSQPTVRVVRVFKFTRNGSMARFDAYAAKITAKPGAVGKIMAWHGTRTENLQGLSRAGLLMPENLPRGISISGKAFGRGLYHAPAWPATGHKVVGGMPTDGTNGAFKSLNYTSLSGSAYGGGSSRSAFMFLQDVALGAPDVHTVACWDKHRPNDWPNKDFIFACGARNQGGFVHDELVTFDQDAQVFRYLVEVESC